MSMSDARQFAELTARVELLEELCRSLAASVDALEGRVFGIDVHAEVLGPVPDPEARDGLDGLRTLLRERRAAVMAEANAPSGGVLDASGGAPGASGDDPVLEDKPEADPGLKDRLAALQGGEAVPPRSGAKK